MLMLFHSFETTTLATSNVFAVGCVWSRKVSSPLSSPVVFLAPLYSQVRWDRELEHRTNRGMGSIKYYQTLGSDDSH